MVLGTGVLALAQAHAGQADSRGFIEDSTLDLLARNVYFDKDRHAPGSRDNREWGQGFQLSYVSGFTRGTVGFGVDLHAYSALKLDSGRGRSGTGLLPVDADGRARDESSSLGGALKLQVSSTVLKYGDLRPYNPVIAVADARLVPATATGFQLTSAELDGLTVAISPRPRTSTVPAATAASSPATPASRAATSTTWAAATASATTSASPSTPRATRTSGTSTTATATTPWRWPTTSR